MRDNRTELIFVLDRSGSMEHLTEETIWGFNSLIEKQKEESKGEVFVTTVLFDDKYELLHNHKPLDEIQRLTKHDYYARGCTALLDAVGRTIDNVGERLSTTDEAERPGKILFVITTDGYENASRDYTKRKVKEMITLQQETYNWKFLFLGADIDAVGEADSLGIRSAGACMPTATPQGVKSSFNAVSKIANFVCAAPSFRRKEGNLELDEMFDAECTKAFSEVE